ncbi:hypothetical protein GCM10010912_44080 [Paenibacillus albidus]|uniref:Uncharacterized protein n=1 Tax=Paenibacillus albidus TaxID=2041023 RepID=A0A917FQ40_9BACL|nr:hypothetical protein [Paenibacillus albidus]GGF94304.1 hypothetical protein GCM10010912_44080 [Paenibacillus albidus]
MRADVQNLFMGIHMLYLAHDKDLTIVEMQPELENLGYRVAEREVKQELERLTQENFLTAHDDAYSITGTGIQEFKAIQSRLQVLCTEVLKPVKAVGTSG